MTPTSPCVSDEGEIDIAVRRALAGETIIAGNPPLTPRADIGVLLVHGIGNHLQGATLRAFGQPLLDWLKDWMRGKGGQQTRGSVTVSEARFIDPLAPAHALAEVRCVDSGVQGEVRRESWLFCEGWWGATVQPPASFQLLRWMWTRGPLLIYWHFYIRQTASKPKSKLAFLDIVFSLIALLLAGFCQLVIGIAMLLSIIPIGPWRRKVIDAVRALTLTLGDSYVLEEDIQRAALVDRVRRALDWLAQRTDRTVVIAHSQGGAIAHEVLRHNSPENLALFITVGSGLEKLHFLREVVIGRKGLAMAWLLFPLTVLGTVVATSSREHWSIGLGLLFLIAALVLAAGLVAMLDRYKEQLTKAVPELALPVLGEKRWIDIYASDDVVPMSRGSLLATAHFLERIKVFNERSYVRDHVAYFKNVNDCLAIMWQNLAHFSKLVIFNPGDEERLGRFARVHKGYAHVISFSRLALFIAIFLGGYVLRDSLLGFGHSVIESTEGTIIGDWLKPVRGFAGIVASMIKRFGKADSITPEVLANGLFGALVLLGVIALWWLIFRRFWVSRCVAQWRKACHGGDLFNDPWARVRVWIAWTVVLCLGCLPLIVSIILATRPDYLTVDRLGNVVSVALGGLALLLACFYAGAAPWIAEAMWHNRTQPFLMRILGPVGIAWIIFIMLRIVQWFLPGLDPTLVAIAPMLFGLVLALAWQVYGVLKVGKDSYLIWAIIIPAVPIAGTAGAFFWRGALSYATAILIYLGLTGAVLLIVFCVRQFTQARLSGS